MSPRRFSALFMLPLAALLGCASNMREEPTVEQLEENAAAASQEYVIGANDTLAINVWKETELSLPQVEVRLDGKISMPLLDDVQAAGLTPSQLKANLTERLKEYTSAPQVTVIVVKVGSKMVYVMGEVQHEGVYNLQPSMRVLDALAISGGFTAFAGKTRVKIIRQAAPSPSEFNFDYEAFVDGSNVAQNILLLPGAQIIVPEERPFWR